MPREIIQRYKFQGEDKTKKATRSVSKGLKSVETSARKAGAVIAGFLSVAAIGGLIKSSLQAGDNLAKMADRIGTTTEALAAMHHAGSIVGSSLESVDKGLEKMIRSLGDVASGVGESTRIQLTKIGVELKDIINLPADQQFERIAGGISSLNTQSEKAAAAAALFGRGGIEMLNFLDAAAVELKRAREETVLFGTALSRVDAAKIEEANDQMYRAGQVIQGVGLQITTQLAPAIDDLMDEFLMFAKANGGVPQLIKDAVDQATEAWETLKIAAVVYAGYIGGSVFLSAITTAAAAITALGTAATASATLATAATVPFAALAGALTALGYVAFVEGFGAALGEGSTQLERFNEKVEETTEAYKAVKMAQDQYVDGGGILTDMDVAALERLRVEAQSAADVLEKLRNPATKSATATTTDTGGGDGRADPVLEMTEIQANAIAAVRKKLNNSLASLGLEGVERDKELERQRYNNQLESISKLKGADGVRYQLQEDAAILHAAKINEINSKQMEEYLTAVKAQEDTLADSALKGREAEVRTSEREYETMIAKFAATNLSTLEFYELAEGELRLHRERLETINDEWDEKETDKVAARFETRMEGNSKTADLDAAIRKRDTDDKQKAAERNKKIETSAFSFAKALAGKNQKLMQGIAVVEAGINFARALGSITTGAANALATVPFPANLAAVGTVLAAGAPLLASLTALGGGGKSSAGGGVGSTSATFATDNNGGQQTAAATETRRGDININVGTGLYTPEMIQGLIGALNEAFEDGQQIKVRLT